MQKETVTVDDIMKILEKTALNDQRYREEEEKRREEFERKLQEEAEARQKALQAERLARQEALQAERLARQEAIKESQKALEAKLAAEFEVFKAERKIIDEEARARAKELDRQIGRLTNRIGKLVEAIVSANIHLKFNDKFGFHFQAASPSHKVDNFELDIHLEVDFFLTNKDSEMLIEVKTHFTEADIDKHINRIEKMKRHNLSIDNNRTLFAAAAGGIMSIEVKNYALNKGFYVLEIIGENIDIQEPATIATW
jgi:multidrug efflux pump subunit AcrA (membrane-fusion protein)